ncbi:MAG: hypothetical protein N3E49_06495 [Bacteroidia bacterium]|nr:hypothetical protein [Bacteroidia bacterium]
MSRLWGLIIGACWAQAWYEPPIRRWQAMEVGPIMVWYTEGQEGLAQQVGQWGADAYRELVSLLEFQPEAKLTLRLYPSPQAWAQSPTFAPKGMLVPPSVVAGVYPLSSRAATAALIRSEMTALILQQLYFSEGVRLQNRSLLYLPDWFFWGFAYFWGEGWTGEDLARLADIPPRVFTELSKRTASPSPLYKSLYKSIWFYLYRSYGQRKVIDLLYMTRLTRSTSEAIYLTLNLSEEDLWERWQAFLRTLAKESALAGEELEKRPVLTAAVAADGVSRAFAVLTGNKVRYYIRTEETLYELPGDWYWRSGYLDPPVEMSFSPQGTLVWTAYSHKGLMLWQWNPLERQYNRFPLPLLAIQGLSWDGEKQLLFSGLDANGKVKLYSFTFPQGTLTLLGEAQGDLLYPQRFRGQLYAIWQPDTSRLSPLSVLWEPNRPVQEVNRRWEPLPYPPYYSVGGGWIVHDTALTTISDIVGDGYPWTFAGDTSYPAQWEAGSIRQWAGATRDEVFFLRYRSGRLRLAKAPRSTLLSEGRTYPPISAAEAIQFRLQRQAAHFATYSSDAPPRLKAPIDTFRNDTPRTQRQPFYLFDEDVSRPPRRRARNRLVPEAIGNPKQSIPSPRALGQVPYHWILWELRLEPVLHPLIRFGWEINATARDWQSDHAWSFLWRPYIDLRSSEFQLSYTRYRARVQPVVELYKQSHFFPARRYNTTLRITSWQGRLSIRHPLSPTLIGEAYLMGIISDRYNIGRTGDRDFSAQSRSIGVGMRWTYENRTRREGFSWSGWHASLRMEVLRESNRWRYPLAFLRAERFQPILDRIVLHLSGTAAAGGPNGRYFLLGGIPEWINYEFQNRAQVPLLTDPVGYFLTEYAFMPGFPYQARRGRNLILGSVVAHMPLLAWRRDPHLPTRPIYNLDWYVGYHIGTTWTTGNPFSQKNPIDAEFIFRPPLVISVQTLKSPFILSFGTGLSFQIMKLPLSAEVYWPVEEGRITRANFIAGIKRQF